MQKLRKSDERGLAEHGWLKSRHTFSFADYYDPAHMGFRSLRVINEDRIQGGTGFGKHPHRDMEIISYVVSGALEHQDSMGNKAIIVPGEVQRLSAGTGITHSEKNFQQNDETHFFQVWITPKKMGDPAGYGQKNFAQDLDSKKMVLVISENAREGSLGIRQDADMYISRLKNNDQVTFQLRPGRGAWIQVVRGKLSINEEMISTGDASSFEHAELLNFQSYDRNGVEFILFDLA